MQVRSLRRPVRAIAFEALGRAKKATTSPGRGHGASRSRRRPGGSRRRRGSSPTALHPLRDRRAGRRGGPGRYAGGRTTTLIGEGQRAGEAAPPGREERAVGLEDRGDPGVGEVPSQGQKSLAQGDGMLVAAVVEDADAVADPDVPETPGQRAHVAQAGRGRGGLCAQGESRGEGERGVDPGPGREQPELASAPALPSARPARPPSRPPARGRPGA